jgi:hypothetical protein
MYYSYVEIEYVATSFSPARTDLALKLLMPWFMTHVPPNEAVRRENCAEKTLIRKKINHQGLGDHDRCKDSITIKEA